MNILLVMIPLSILLALGAGIAFFWAVDHDQFDDMDTPALDILRDDPNDPRPPRNSAKAEPDDGKPADAD